MHLFRVRLTKVHQRAFFLSVQGLMERGGLAVFERHVWAPPCSTPSDPMKISCMFRFMMDDTQSVSQTFRGL